MKLYFISQLSSKMILPFSGCNNARYNFYKVDEVVLAYMKHSKKHLK
jgi:hypothetical protein